MPMRCPIQPSASRKRTFLWPRPFPNNETWLTDTRLICSIRVCLYSFLLDRKFLLFDNRIKQARTRSVFFEKPSDQQFAFQFFSECKFREKLTSTSFK